MNYKVAGGDPGAGWLGKLPWFPVWGVVCGAADVEKLFRECFLKITGYLFLKHYQMHWHLVPRSSILLLYSQYEFNVPILPILFGEYWLPHFTGNYLDVNNRTHLLINCKKAT